MTVRKNGYVVENGFDLHTVSGRTYIHLDGDVARCLEYYRHEKLAGVIVNPARGYIHDSLEPIVRLGPDIQVLFITQTNHAFSLDPLYKLERLRSLSIDGACNLNVARFGSLENLSASFCNDLTLHDSALKSLSLSILPKGRDIDGIPAIRTLRALSVAESRKSNIDALSHLAGGLECLSFAYCRKLRSIEGVQQMRNLRVFYADTCTRLVDHDALAGCGKLEAIRLNDCGEIASIDFVQALPMLVEFRCVGSKVVDGQMGNLLRVQWAAFDRRKHYSHTPEEVDAVLRKKGGGAVPRAGDHYRSRWPNYG